MGCDAYADEKGMVGITISSYDEPNNTNKQRVVFLCGLEPHERVDIELVLGEWR